MSYEVSFFGKLIPTDQFAQAYQFEMIDIFAEQLPPRLHPLTGMENVILTPHVAAGSVQAGEDIHATAIENIVDILSGRWPPHENIVNPTVVPRFPLAERD